jgi:hypothetical protein
MTKRPALAFALAVGLACGLLPSVLRAAAVPRGGAAGTGGATNAAPPRKTIAAVRTAGPIVVDGILSESVWKTAARSDFTQSDPLDGQAPTERTEVWVAFDADSLYVAARLHDSEPDKVIGLLGRRDEITDSDWFYFAIDPYLDRRSGYLFAVNPAGSRADGTLSNDENLDMTWDGIWDSAARRDAEGWTVEIRIPFRQLRFKTQESYTWGISFRRTIKRKNENDDFAWIPKEESGLVSRFADLTGVRGIEAGRRIELMPFALGRARFSPAVPGDPFHTGQSYGADAGFDLRARLRSNLTLSATANPDFGQVEIDPAVINISDQETYYAEERPFFVEGSSIFNFGGGGVNAYRSFGWTDPAFFYSRRIGRAPQGGVASAGFVDAPDFTTILGAAKVTGKIGKDFNLGFLDALTSREFADVDQDGARSRAEIEPFSNYGVLRGLKEFDDGGRGIGFLATSVLRDLRTADLSAQLARRAFALAVDGWTALDKDRVWVLTSWLGGTTVSGSREAITRLQMSSLHYFQRPDIDYAHVDPEATSLSGWAGRLYVNKQSGNVIFDAGLGAMSPGFEANDLGYHTRGDLINGHAQIGYQTFHPDTVFRRWDALLTYYRSYDFGGNRTDEYWYLDVEGQFLNYWTLALHTDYQPPKFSHWLTRGGPYAYYPPGTTYQAAVTSDNRSPFVVTAKAYLRTHPSGGYNWSLAGSLVWKPGSNLSLSVAPSYVWRYSQGEWVTKVVDPLMTATYGTRYILADIIQKTFPIEIRLNWTFTPQLSLQVYLQPYIGTGDYRAFKQLRAARTFDFDFFGTTGESTLAFDGTTYTADPDGPGPAAPLSFRNPDFSLKSLRGTIVLRWEFRPGSMAYFVWTQKRADTSDPGDFELGRDFSDLFRAPGDNIFLFKLSYRFEL